MFSIIAADRNVQTEYKLVGMVIFIHKLDCNKKYISMFLIGRYGGFSGVGSKFENLETSGFQSELLKFVF